MSSDNIKDVIRDFIKFDIENDYYKEEDKNELVKMFQKILFDDDSTVRQFLKALFEQTKNLANEYSLVAAEGENLEEPVEDSEPEDIEPEDIEHEDMEPEDIEHEDMEPEDIENEDLEESSKRMMRSLAANFLYE